MVELLQAVHDSVTAAPPGPIDTPLAVAAATFLLGAGQFLQWLSAHNKGKKGATQGAETWERIEKKVDGVVEKLDQYNERLTKQEHRLVGVDGDNGVTGKVRDMETRLRELEKAS